MADAKDPFRQGWPTGVPVPTPGKQRCVWCQGPLQAGEGQVLASTPAVCDACAAVLSSVGRQPLAAFIEKLAAPVLVLTPDCVATLANAKACAFLGKTAERLVGQRAGDVIECVHAAEPGGCGQTLHCKGCAVRRSVEHTHTTGEPLRGVHAYQDIRTPNGIRTAWFELTTERAGDLVLLRIDDVGVERQA
jgi:PAS domain-containing protein